MKMRSWLFVPGDSERKLAKVAGCSADVVVIDLEDAVGAEAKGTARMLAREWLSAHRQQVTAGDSSARWARINRLDGPLWREDLAAVMPGQPDGIMVPKASGPEQLRMLSAEIYELEQRNGMTPNTVRIVPLVSETAAAALSIRDYAAAELPRIQGLTWGAEDLAAAIGATRKRDANGQWTDLFRMVRATLLLTAHARKMAAIDTLYPDFRDLKGLKLAAEIAQADGFTGMLAIHPDQVEVINQAFTPSAEQLDRARAIVSLFADNPGSGALQLDGSMVEPLHLEQARRLLRQAG